MVYIPPAFRDTDRNGLVVQITASGFATLITVGDDGPLVSHLPLLLDPEAGPAGVLTGHLARANPQWRASDLGKPAVAMFMGPDAYVSPSWYASKREHGKVVPTWNYSVIYARGMLDVFDEPEELAALVAALSDRHEARFSAPWKVADAPADFIRAQLKGIVGVRLTIATIEGKAKLSQNRPQADQAGVIAGLRTRERAADRAIADLMERQDAR